jgi:hypothetical protein
MTNDNKCIESRSNQAQRLKALLQLEDNYQQLGVSAEKLKRKERL